MRRPVCSQAVSHNGYKRWKDTDGKRTSASMFKNANGYVRGRTHASAVVEDFCDGWFSAKVSTEPMMRGSANERAVLKAMERMPFLQVVY